jgi:hypothetical protein
MLAQVKTGGAKRAPVFVSDERVHEVLWSAYHRYDESAVTKELLRRYLQPERQHRPRRRKLSHG